MSERRSLPIVCYDCAEPFQNKNFYKDIMFCKREVDVVAENKLIQGLIFDWNFESKHKPQFRSVEVDDETLRDGLQNASVRHPSIGTKRKCLEMMVALGIQRVNLGLPMSSQFEHIRALARMLSSQQLPIKPGVAVRTEIADLETVARLRDEFPDIELRANVFIGASQIRMFAQNWSFEKILDMSRNSLQWANQHGIPFMFVTEDTTRSRPEDIEKLYVSAASEGASEVCVADTVGHATPWGAAAVVEHLRMCLDRSGYTGVKINWHGHSDRGLSLINSLAVIAAGADVIHGTILGIGERSGNTPLDLLLVNLKLLGFWPDSLSELPKYVMTISRATCVQIPVSYPVFGRDAFRTSTGVHCAAIEKAEKMGLEELKNRVYCGVPASLVGRVQEIAVGRLSGSSCVRFWLRKHGYRTSSQKLIALILGKARNEDRILSDSEIHRIVESQEGKRIFKSRKRRKGE